MIEKIKGVTNPLTIIAIFAALAEIAGTIALSLVTSELQVIFVWFVMLFPSMIVIFFFLTLNFNPKVLYAPSDYRNEENYLQAMYGAAEIKGSLEIIEQQLDAAKEEILRETEDKISSTNSERLSNLREIISSQLLLVKEEINSTKENATELGEISFEDVPMSAQQAKVMKVLSVTNGSLPANKIAEAIGISLKMTVRSLHNLSRRGIIKIHIDNCGNEEFSLAKKE